MASSARHRSTKSSAKVGAGVRPAARNTTAEQAGTQERPDAKHSATWKSGVDTEHFRKLLEDELQRLEMERDHIESRTARNGVLVGGGESQYDDHMADIATETQDREIDLASADNVYEIVEQVNVALEKIRTKTYGSCDVCGKPISRARLNALPYATLCMQCQSYIES